jgi:hypothetical protein
MIDDDTLIQLLRITAELIEQCKALSDTDSQGSREDLLENLERLTKILVSATSHRFQ